MPCCKAVPPPGASSLGMLAASVLRHLKDTLSFDYGCNAQTPQEGGRDFIWACGAD